MKKNCAILVMSCDAYSDLWHDFFVLKEKNWPDCPYPTYLVSNNQKCDERNVETICCGDELNWTGRLLYALEKVSADYILLMLEDYYISRPVSNDTLDDVFEYIGEKNVAYYKLEERANLNADYYEGCNYIKKVDGNVEYGISLLTSIWTADFLKQVIGGEDYPAWEFEVRRNMPDDVTRNLDCLCLVDNRNVLNIMHMVQRGQYIPSSISKLKALGYPINTKERGELGFMMMSYLKLYHQLRKTPFLFSLVRRVRSIFGAKSVSEKYMEEIKHNKYN